MAQNSKIEWTHHTANLWWGCTAVHAGCDHCYAETLAKRHGQSVWGNDNPRKATKSVWNDFLKWQALAHAAGENHRVFVGSMMDIFEKDMPLVNWQNEPAIDSSDGSPIGIDALRQKFFTEIVPNCQNLTFLLLTKRPSNINKQIPEDWKISPPANVMFGASAVDQLTFNQVVNELSKVNGKRFLSVEPQLSPIYPGLCNAFVETIDWVIQGGESGPNRRPFDIEWARSMRDYCLEHKVPYFFKQIDKIQEIPYDLHIREFPTLTKYYYLKKDEIVEDGDEVEMSAKYNDSAKWVKASEHSIGTPAPDPQFMAHRVYRRLIRF